MKIAKITLQYTPATLNFEGYNRFRLEVDEGHRQHTVDKFVRDTDLVSHYDLMMKILVAEMRDVLLGKEKK